MGISEAQGWVLIIGAVFGGLGGLAAAIFAGLAKLQLHGQSGHLGAQDTVLASIVQRLDGLACQKRDGTERRHAACPAEPPAAAQETEPSPGTRPPQPPPPAAGRARMAAAILGLVSILGCGSTGSLVGYDATAGGVGRAGLRLGAAVYDARASAAVHVGDPTLATAPVPPDPEWCVRLEVCGLPALEFGDLAMADACQALSDAAGPVCPSQ